MNADAVCVAVNADDVCVAVNADDVGVAVNVDAVCVLQSSDASVEVGHRQSCADCPVCTGHRPAVRVCL